jgi:PPOX class probable F420-dependent enzyme
VTTTLTVPESHRDLVTAATVALSTTNPDGSIQSTAIWVQLGADGVLRTSLAKARRKYENLLERPQVTVFAISPQNPFKTLEVRAEAEITPDDDRSFFASIVGDYGQSVETMAAQAAEDRVVVTFRPVRVRAQG